MLLSIQITTYKGGYEEDDKQTMIVMMPRGLAAAILALNFGPGLIENLMPGMEGFYKDVAFVVRLGTAIICTIGVSLICFNEKKKNPNLGSEEIEKIIDEKSE